MERKFFRKFRDRKKGDKQGKDEKETQGGETFSFLTPAGLYRCRSALRVLAHPALSATISNIKC